MPQEKSFDLNSDCIMHESQDSQSTSYQVHFCHSWSHASSGVKDIACSNTHPSFKIKAISSIIPYQNIPTRKTSPNPAQCLKTQRRVQTRHIAPVTHHHQSSSIILIVQGSRTSGFVHHMQRGNFLEINWTVQMPPQIQVQNGPVGAKVVPGANREFPGAGGEN